MAFASALGSLGATEAAGRLLALLRSARGRDVRTEFALALARLVGEEHHFIQLLRRVGTEPGTALSQEVTRLKGFLIRSHQSSVEIEEALDAAAEALAKEALEEGVGLLGSALEMLLLERGNHWAGSQCVLVIQDCVAQIGRLGADRLEYVVLALHGLECGIGGG
jgi:hypothetical protein